MTTGRGNQGTGSVMRVPHRARPNEAVRDVAMRVNQFVGLRIARSCSQSFVLLTFQMNVREPRRERVANRDRSGTRRLSGGRKRISAIVHLQALGVYSCFKEGRYQLGRSSSEYTPNAGPVRTVCPTKTRRKNLKYSEAA